MDHIGIEVHKRDSQICLLAAGGELIERRIRTEPERFAAVLGGRPRARIVIEASTDSEWVARCLESLGHDVLLVNPDNPARGPDLQRMEIAARSWTVELQPFEVRGPNEFAGALSAIAKTRVDAIVIHQDGKLNASPRAIADVTTKYRLPSVGIKEFAEAGGLIGYGANFLEMYRRASIFVDKILKGAKPADLPVEGATRFELVINRKTAKALGVTIPNPFLLRADQVIRLRAPAR